MPGSNGFIGSNNATHGAGSGPGHIQRVAALRMLPRAVMARKVQAIALAIQILMEQVSAHNQLKFWKKMCSDPPFSHHYHPLKHN